MFIFKHGGRRGAQLTTTVTKSKRHASRISIPFAPPPFPVIEACPSPTCQCRETPPGLEIEREQNLNGSMAAYAEQVLISTGRSDWKSKIEEEDEGILVRQLKSLIGPRGKHSDPFHNVMLTNSSFQRTTPNEPAHQDSPPSASAFLLPSFKYIPTIPTDSDSVAAFAKAFLLPSRLHQQHDALTREQQNILLRQPELQRHFLGVRQIDEILILICGHGGRDVRCGTLGPILKDEFEDKLARQNIEVLHDTSEAGTDAQEGAQEVRRSFTPKARVGLISHIGGHKWAGNIIIHIPPRFSHNALAGKGIWYGRVGPEHVEGIVAKTVLGGKVIKEMFRGGIDSNGGILRL